MKIKIERATSMQDKIIQRIKEVFYQTTTPLKKELTIENYTDYGVVISEGVLYENDIKKLGDDYKLFFDNGLVVLER